MIPVVAGSNPVGHPNFLSASAFPGAKSEADPAEVSLNLPPMDPLETLTGHTFANPALLAEALTHPSLAYETQRDHPNNQRLEYLGDAVLQLIFTDHLYVAFPGFTEGGLTKLRSRLVSRPALAAYARRIALGSHLRMGRGEEVSGGRGRASTLADAFEALVAAIYLDAGLEAARAAVLRMCREDLVHISAAPVELNPKGELQEFLQAFTLGSPRYSITREEGPDHLKVFDAKVDWNGRTLGTGTGASKKEAETAAAAAALKGELVAELRVSGKPLRLFKTRSPYSPRTGDPHIRSFSYNFWKQEGLQSCSPLKNKRRFIIFKTHS